MVWWPQKWKYSEVIGEIISSIKWLCNVFIQDVVSENSWLKNPKSQIDYYNPLSESVPHALTAPRVSGALKVETGFVTWSPMATGECHRLLGGRRSGPATDSGSDRTLARFPTGERARRSGPELAERFGAESRHESPEQRVRAPPVRAAAKERKPAAGFCTENTNFKV